MVLTLYGKPHPCGGWDGSAGLRACRCTIAGTIGYMLAGLPRNQALDLPPLSLGFVSLHRRRLDGCRYRMGFVAIFGVRVAHALPKRQLEIAFGVFLLLLVSWCALSASPWSQVYL